MSYSERVSLGEGWGARYCLYVDAKENKSNGGQQPDNRYAAASMGDPIVFFCVRIGSAASGSLSSSFADDEPWQENRPSVADAFDRLFMIKEGMSQEEIEESREALNSIRESVKARSNRNTLQKSPDGRSTEQLQQSQSLYQDLSNSGEPAYKRKRSG